MCPLDNSVKFMIPNTKSILQNPSGIQLQLFQTRCVIEEEGPNFFISKDSNNYV